MSRDFDAIIVGSGPGGSTAADVLTAAGWSVLIFERGKNFLVNTEKPSELLYEFSNDEIKYWSRHFLGPDPWLEPRTFRVSPERRRPDARRRGEQPAGDRRRRGHPRRRQGAALSRG